MDDVMIEETKLWRRWKLIIDHTDANSSSVRRLVHSFVFLYTVSTFRKLKSIKNGYNQFKLFSFHWKKNVFQFKIKIRKIYMIRRRNKSQLIFFLSNFSNSRIEIRDSTFKILKLEHSNIQFYLFFLSQFTLLSESFILNINSLNESINRFRLCNSKKSHLQIKTQSIDLETKRSVWIDLYVWKTILIFSIVLRFKTLSL